MSNAKKSEAELLRLVIAQAAKLASEADDPRDARTVFMCAVSGGLLAVDGGLSDVVWLARNGVKGAAE